MVVFNEGCLGDTAGDMKVSDIQKGSIGGVDFEFQSSTLFRNWLRSLMAAPHQNDPGYQQRIPTCPNPNPCDDLLCVA